MAAEIPKIVESIKDDEWDDFDPKAKTGADDIDEDEAHELGEDEVVGDLPIDDDVTEDSDAKPA